MQCKSCNEEVSPKFAHAISTNTCPLCGNEIMDAELQESLTHLGNAMRATEKYPSQIFDWLKSNFDLVKESDLREKMKVEAKLKPRATHQSASSEQVDFTSDPNEDDEVLLDSQGNQITGKPIQDPSVTNKFLKNAGVKKRNETLKNLVNQIKKTTTPAKSQFSDVNPEDISGEDLARMNPDELEQLESIVSGDMGGASSALSGSDDGYDDDIPSFVLNMANGGKKSHDYNQKDVLRLQELHNKTSSARSELSRSGGVGLIRR